jgi:anti-sigma factor ChrR (cupin superfamily)
MKRDQYLNGDLDAAEREVDRRLVVGEKSDCVFLAALDGGAG